MIFWSNNKEERTRLLSILNRIPLLQAIYRLKYKRSYNNSARDVFDIHFDSPFGIASGYDENCEFYQTLSNFGAGFVEIGPIGLKEKDGKGVEEAVARLRLEKPSIKLVAHLTNRNTLGDNIDETANLARSMALLYDFVDLFVIDSMASGVTEDINHLSEIIDKMLETRRYFDVKRPILVNITQGTCRSDVDAIVAYTMHSGLDGVVVKDCSLVEYIHKKTSGNLIIVASGDGIGTPEMAYRMLCEGASLVEFDEALLREGPILFKKANQLLHTLRKQNSRQ